MKKTALLLVLFFAASTFGADARKITSSSDRIRPQWIGRHINIRQFNDSYEFLTVTDAGGSLEAIKANETLALSSHLRQKNRIDGVIDRNIILKNTDGNIANESSIGLSFRSESSTEDFICRKIDTYWECLKVNKSSQYIHYTLYAVSHKHNGAEFDRFEVTDRYGARGLWRSAIVPGWGQMYKGSYGKGGLIIGGLAVLGGGIVYTESIRRNCITQMSQTHNGTVIKQLSAKEAGWATGRNICIGAAAALYLYNIIDSTVAPGGRRIKVTPGGVRLNF